MIIDKKDEDEDAIQAAELEKQVRFLSLDATSSRSTADPFLFLSLPTGVDHLLLGSGSFDEECQVYRYVPRSVVSLRISFFLDFDVSFADFDAFPSLSSSRSASGKASTSSEADYRAVLDMVLSDLVVVVYSPEWPASVLLLGWFCKLMVRSLPPVIFSLDPELTY